MSGPSFVLWIKFSVRHMLLLATSLCFWGCCWPRFWRIVVIVVWKGIIQIVYSCRQAKLKQSHHNMYKASFPCRSS